MGTGADALSRGRDQQTLGGRRPCKNTRCLEGLPPPGGAGEQPGSGKQIESTRHLSVCLENLLRWIPTGRLGDGQRPAGTDRVESGPVAPRGSLPPKSPSCSGGHWRALRRGYRNLIPAPNWTPSHTLEEGQKVNSGAGSLAPPPPSRLLRPVVLRGAPAPRPGLDGPLVSATTGR